jgi:hypothetical protein
MIRIYADFNTQDEAGRVCLNVAGSLVDIARYGDSLCEGMDVILDVRDEFEVIGKLVFDEGIWKGIPDWSTVRHYDDIDSTDSSV